mgnify:CR=1 FL=1
MKDKLKIQTIGWLLLIISLLISGSMIGYDLTEEPTLVAQKINNPFNILGVYIGFYLMKLGFGYAALMIPMILATISFLSLFLITLTTDCEKEIVQEEYLPEEEIVEAIVDPFYADLNESSSLEDYLSLIHI